MGTVSTCLWTKTNFSQFCLRPAECVLVARQFLACISGRGIWLQIGVARFPGSGAPRMRRNALPQADIFFNDLGRLTRNYIAMSAGHQMLPPARSRSGGGPDIAAQNSAALLSKFCHKNLA